jgi:hypothetical protein
MSKPLDPAIMLATSMHAQPGVYAVLVGSGISRSSGIPTGWGIVEELVKRVAAQSGSSLAEGDSPEDWWLEQHGVPLGYSSLLAALAPTPATRQGLLAPFFERTSEDPSDVAKRPTAAHRALAQLVKRGAVRVIVTTNFDRLIEQALTEVGIEPQVISRPDAVSGMAPLAHAPATVVKLHGDYLDVESLNTAEELASYPDAWNKLLEQIFDEYGLVVSGWSADWDTALVSAMERTPARRYPLYWDSRSSDGVNSKRLLLQRQGLVIPTPGADEMFTSLVDNLAALDSLSEPPLTTALAVARLKRYLPDPLRRIDLFDLIQGRLDAIKGVSDKVGALGFTTYDDYDAAITTLNSASFPLLRLLAEGVFHDDGTHDDLWVRTLQSLLFLQTPPTGSFNQAMKALQHLPAQLALFSMGAVAIDDHRDGLLLRLAREPQWQSPFGNRVSLPASASLHLGRVVQFEAAQGLPRWGGQRWLYPQSELLRNLLSPVLRDVVPAERFEERIDDVEYRLAVLQWLHPGPTGRHPHAGRYLYEGNWSPDGGPHAEERLLEASARPGVSAAYVTDGHEDLPATALELRPILAQMQRF